MKTIIFHCKILTPAFIGEAQRNAIELRPPAIKAALRYWLRAIRPQLCKENDFSEMQYEYEEVGLFGGSRKEVKDNRLQEVAYKSAFSIIVQNIALTEGQQKLLPHKPNSLPVPDFVSGSFDIVFYYQKEQIRNKLLSLMRIVSVLGGLGKRARRGMGAFQILRIDGVDNSYNREALIEDLNCISESTDNVFSPSGNTITSSFTPIKPPDYPFIEEINIGTTVFTNNTLKTLAQATSDLNVQYGNVYANTMGSAMGFRLASPVYTTIATLDGRTIVVITRLHNTKTQTPNSTLIQDFQNKLL